MKYTLNTQLKDKLNILLYHGVTDKPNEGIINYQGKHINKDDFLFQMEFIKKRCSPLSIDEWVEIKQNNKRVPEYPTIISFDDGFKNNITIAAPILDSLKIPSVFYITTGVIDTKKMFWEEGKKFVRLRLSTKGLRTIKKYGLNAAAKKFEVDLHKFTA